jgi:hypothetical protein
MKTEQEIRRRLSRLEKEVEASFNNEVVISLQGRIRELKWMLKIDD